MQVWKPRRYSKISTGCIYAVITRAIGNGNLDKRDQKLIFNQGNFMRKVETERYVIVRTYSAGVFSGTLISRVGQEVVLKNARRLWYWDGAASLSQLAVDGVSNPENCKFPVEVESITLLQAIEVINCTEAAKQSIAAVKIWRK
jgi:hypothetical protein